MKNLKNKEAVLLAQAIVAMGQTAIDDLDTAMSLVEINDKVSNAAKLNDEALNKLVVFTKEEKAFDAKNKELQQKITEANKAEVEVEIKQLMADNSAVIESIKEKNLKLQKAADELAEKPFKIDLPQIDKTKLPKGLQLWQYASLQPILK